MLRRHRTILFLAWLPVLLAAPTHAQIDPDPDGVGIYADTGATQVSAMAALGTPVELYVIATNLSEDDIVVWNLRIAYDAGLWAGGITIPYVHHGRFLHYNPNGISVAVWNDYDAPSPLGYGPHMHLLTFTAICTDYGPQSFYLRNYHHGVIEPYPEYYSMATIQPGTSMVELHPSSGSFELPVFTFNGEDPIADEVLTLGQVKALYR